MEKGDPEEFLAERISRDLPWWQAPSARSNCPHQSLRHPFRIDEEQELRISSSIGVALYPEHGTDPKTLMHHADQAMYQAKRGGKNNFTIAPETVSA